MRKALYTDEQTALAGLLREARMKAGLTQVQLADALGKHQTFVSNVEGGRRRLDLVELRQVCGVRGVDLVSLVKRWERELRRGS